MQRRAISDPVYCIVRLREKRQHLLEQFPDIRPRRSSGSLEKKFPHGRRAPDLMCQIQRDQGSLARERRMTENLVRGLRIAVDVELGEGRGVAEPLSFTLELTQFCVGEAGSDGSAHDAQASQVLGEAGLGV